MTNTIKRMIAALGILFLFFGMMGPMRAFAQEDVEQEIQLSGDEADLITRSQNGEPLKMGIIPHAFPLSDCPPEAPDFRGINVEMLKLITERTGLQFEFKRIPLEEKTPYETLLTEDFELVAGTIRLDDFTNSSQLVLSDRFCDGSAACIAKSGTNPEIPKTGKIAVMKGYQAGAEFAQKQFPQYEILSCTNNQEVVRAVRLGQADLAMISRYVGVYELQNPLNESLQVLTPYQMVRDSCIMGLNTPKTKMAISIIDKALAQIGEEEYNNLQMNFSISNPYELTFSEFLFKYRYSIIVGLIILAGFTYLIARFLYSQKERKALARDALTGAFSEAGFELATARVLAKTNKKFFIVDFDICYFSIFNDMYGKERGNELLKEIVKIVRVFLCEQDIICRSYADSFKVLVSKDTIDELLEDVKKASGMFNKLVERRMIFNFGIYQITDTTIPVSKMIDFAILAKKQVKGKSEDYIGIFDTALHDRHVSEASMISSFDSALETHEFVAYYQPKFDVNTKQMAGAEALVRWITKDGKMISPAAFIELFEQNGQIQRLDFCILEQVCIFQKNLIAQNIVPLPISVNFSRVHFYSSDFIQELSGIVERHGLPKQLIEIECTETSVTCDTETARDILGELRAHGFTIAMDDFGKAYSSLNALRMIPLDVIKLDREFLLATLEDEKEKAKKIIESIVLLAHQLQLKIVAEGVETEGQYLFLKGIGCDWIQGYYFSRPISEEDFRNMFPPQAE